MIFNSYRKFFVFGTFFALFACSSDNSTTPQPPASQSDGRFFTFETGQVRPLAISQDSTRLFATNTPNGTLEIYTINDTGLQHTETVAIGMEPTAVAVLNAGEVWVVNHLSDSVSIVDVTTSPARVVRTLLVGDEPRDIVFAGTGNKFALITTAHRGQNGPNDTQIDPEHRSAGVNRADVWIFNTQDIGSTLGGDPIEVMTFFSDTPRSLAVSPDRNTVYVAAFQSGNQTTTIGENNLDKPGPVTNVQGTDQLDTGLILKYNGSNWADGTGATNDQMGAPWDNKVKLSLPDNDVFMIDISGNQPTKMPVTFNGVGTVLFNMVALPDTLFVSNTDALNQIRFEGPGIVGGSTVRGHFVESRLTVIRNLNSTPEVLPRHLNRHIDYSASIGTQQERDLALANPLEMALSNDGATLYVAGFGSQKIGIYDTAALINGTYTNNSSDQQIMLSAGGPTGVVLNPTQNKLYVLTRFDNGISIIDTTTKTEAGHLTMYNPEPAVVINGRRFLYDATSTSSHGDSSCGLCHVFGDFDSLAWDLGNPDEIVVTNPNQFVNQLLRPTGPGPAVFHPMKGPMSTQSLRGLKNAGPMHWRGDRIGASANIGESIELGAFKDFNVAFPGLVGRESELSSDDMQAFAEFALEITYPPNPIRALDNSLNANQTEGRSIYLNNLTTGGGILKCNDCHVLDPNMEHFGTAGLSTREGPDISQEFKVPHLRNAYQKVGMFGTSGKFAPNSPQTGDQIRGFGFMHDGAMGTLENFLSGSVFRFDLDQTINNEKRNKVIDFVMAFDSNLAPIVGQQITLTTNSGNDVNSRIDLLIAQAKVTSPRTECDLIVKGVIDGIERGALLLANGTFQTDRKNSVLTEAELRLVVNNNNQSLTFTCVPPESGNWMGIDRDMDGYYDRDEIDNGTDPLVVNPL